MPKLKWIYDMKKNGVMQLQESIIMGSLIEVYLFNCVIG